MPALREGAAVTASAAGLRVKASILGRDASPFGNPQRFPVFPKVERPSRRWGAGRPRRRVAAPSALPPALRREERRARTEDSGFRIR
ncbi:unnamed protein product, partial [Prorocentrum cordatum]